MVACPESGNGTVVVEGHEKVPRWEGTKAEGVYGLGLCELTELEFGIAGVFVFCSSGDSAKRGRDEVPSLLGEGQHAGGWGL